MSRNHINGAFGVFRFDILRFSLLWNLMENSMFYVEILLVRKVTEIGYFQWFLLRFIDKIEEIMHVIPNLTSS